MTGTEKGLLRVLAVEEDECIGCRACSNLWPEISAAVGLSDRGAKRTIIFPSFFEEFETRIAESLAEICPTGAISFGLADILPDEESFSLTFEMVRCRRCRTPFATGKELEYIESRLSDDVRGIGSEISWTDLCPNCRRSAFREGAAREVIVRRSGARR